MRLLLFLLLLASLPETPLAARQVADEPLFSFGVITDVQYCDCEVLGSRYYRASPRKLTEAVEALNRQDLAFVIQLGDLIDKDKASYQAVLPLYQQLKSPAYHVLGNHEFSVDSTWIDAIPKLLGMERRYYEFAVQGWRFIVLDGNDLSFHATHEESPVRNASARMYEGLVDAEAINAQTWNGGLGAAQLAWLSATVQQASEAGERIVLFSHFPVYPENAHNLWNAHEVVALMKAHPGVVAYMSGHNHAGNYGENEGIHYVTFQGMVETPESNAYAVVDVYPTLLKVRGFGREPVRQLKLRN